MSELSVVAVPEFLTPVPFQVSPALRRAKVLVIDDEPILGRCIKRTLRHHEVAMVVDGEEGLAKLREGELPDLVLCDLMMPGLTGMELYEELARCRPEVLPLIVFMTGGSFTPATDRFLRDHSTLIINKPFEDGVLEGLVAQALTRARES